MIITCISDLHGNLPDIAPCDLLLIAGDICPCRNEWIKKNIHVDRQLNWLKFDFQSWLKDSPAKNIVGIAGNHDFVFERAYHKIPKLSWHYLCNYSIEIDGLKIYGSPWQKWFYNWAFNAPEFFGEDFLEEKYSSIPVDTDIIISHGPPYMYGDSTNNYKIPKEDRHVGSKSLLAKISEVRPKLVVTGHIHASYGISYLNDTTICNAALTNVEEDLEKDPITFELKDNKLTHLPS